MALSFTEQHNAFTLERNILLSRGEPIYAGGDGGQVDRPGFKSDLNVIWDTTGAELRFGNGNHHPNAEWYLADSHTFTEWNGMGCDLHSVLTDPKLVDAEHGNFELWASSPANSVGFRPIDTCDVGPRPAELWD